MGKIILIADSGTTKTDWSVINDGSCLETIRTKGMNPYFQSFEEITEEIDAVLIPKMYASIGNNSSSQTNGISEAVDFSMASGKGAGSIIIDAIYFYGAGCVFDKVDIMRNALFSCIKASEINVYSDLLAAAHCTCGREAGIACIMGTGSNSCFYDGQSIVKNVPPLGYILGDEGGGVTLGRLLVGDIMKGILPKMLRDKFFEQFKLTQADVLDNVYKRPFPNRFLAGLSPFLSENIDAPEIRAIVVSSFISFFNRNVKQYDYEQYDANFVGSVAYHYSDILMEVAEALNVRIGRILKSPMSGLIEYHNIKNT